MSISHAVPGFMGLFLAGIFGAVALMALALSLVMVVTTARHFRDEAIDILSVVPVLLSVVMVLLTGIAGAASAYLFAGAL